MKKILSIFVVLVLLCGCSASKTCNTEQTLDNFYNFVDNNKETIVKKIDRALESSTTIKQYIGMLADEKYSYTKLDEKSVQDKLITVTTKFMFYKYEATCIAHVLIRDGYQCNKDNPNDYIVVLTIMAYLDPDNPELEMVYTDDVAVKEYSEITKNYK